MQVESFTCGYLVGGSITFASQTSVTWLLTNSLWRVQVYLNIFYVIHFLYAFFVFFNLEGGGLFVKKKNTHTHTGKLDFICLSGYS